MIAFFKLIQFFQDSDRDYDIIFLKLTDTCAVMENDIGIENE